MKTNALQLTLLILILICSSGYAQKYTIGFKGGFSIPNLTGGSSDNPLNTGYSSRFGGDGGIYGEYHVTKNFSVSLGVEYSAQGGQKSGFQAFPVPAQYASYVPSPYLYANFKSVAKMDYLLIPLLARYNWRLGNKSPFRIYAAAGPFAGYLLSAHQVTSGSSLYYADAAKQMPVTTTPQSFDANTNIKNDLYKFNAGIDGFLGISYKLNNQSSLFIEGGGNYGFISIQKGTANGKNYTGAGVVTVGYAFTLQNKYNYQGHR